MAPHSRTIETYLSEFFGATATRSFAKKWQTLAQWPPNVFALTSTLLRDSGAYRLAVSPPERQHWPPDKGWHRRVNHTAVQWRRRPFDVPPSRVLSLGQVLHDHLRVPVGDVVEATHWRLCAALLELHATSDEACIQVGIPVAEPLGDADEAFVTLANMVLADQGTLAILPSSDVIVLPKLRTPQSGITLRSMSHHLSAHDGEVQVRWQNQENICHGPDRRLNLLVVPWPERIEATAFQESQSHRLDDMDTARFGFFRFAPDRVDIEDVAKLVDSAKAKVGRIHGVVFPESAVTADELAKLERRLSERDVSMLVAGVRGPSQNFARLGFYYKGQWRHADQSKHHRWCLDGEQIHQYHLGASLHPAKKWWEDMEVQPRALHVVTANEWLTVCHLICEDLARQEPVASVVRAIGPTLVIALLLDGPQLSKRWPARYATILADDPGSSVLTVTSIGMALRSWAPGQPPSRVVALWKDTRRGTQELSLEPNARALVLTITAHFREEFAADGRSDHGGAAELVLSGVEQIRC